MTERPRPERTPARGIAAPLLVLALLSSACGGGAGAEATQVPSIGHATGATDVILRFEQSGGFMMPGFLATQVPIFTLYGDGTVIFRDPAAEPPPAIGNVVPAVPFQIAHLSEQQIQSLLEFATGPGGLGAAGERYDQPTADAPTAVFSLNAGEVQKVVSVNGLGIDVGPGPDAAVLQALAGLAERLQAFAGEVSDEQPWEPERYRGILMEEAFGPPVQWPWTAISPADFVRAAGPDGPSFPSRVMTPAEVAELELEGFQGGFHGLPIVGPDGRGYTFNVRPLLPDEKA